MASRLDTDSSPKRPFTPLKEKGKGAQPPSGTFPCINNLREASHWLGVLEQQRREIWQAIDALQAQPLPMQIPAVLRSRPGGNLLWRKKSRTPKGQSFFELLSPTGLALLHALPPAVQRTWLDREAERLRLNLQWTLINSSLRALQHYLSRYPVLRQQRKSLPPA